MVHDLELTVALILLLVLFNTVVKHTLEMPAEMVIWFSCDNTFYAISNRLVIVYLVSISKYCTIIEIQNGKSKEKDRNHHKKRIRSLK